MEANNVESLVRFDGVLSTQTLDRALGVEVYP